MSEDTPTTVENPQPKLPNYIWLTPEVVASIIEAEEIFEDIEDELQEG